MTRIIAIFAAFIAVTALCIAVPVQAGSWIPGTPTYAEESDMSDLLERVVDHAYCTGIPRFGHRGEFPYDEYVVFDCDWWNGGSSGVSCFNARYKAVKASRPGYFKAKLIRQCDRY